MDKVTLEKCVKNGIQKCGSIIQEHPNGVLSESDMEKLLCHCISFCIGEDLEKVPEKDNFSVHTQISHYIKKNDKYTIGERVDILVLDENNLEFCKGERKNKYYGISVALELKYLHIGDSVTLVDKDFEKWDNIKEDSSLFIVVLLDSKNEQSFIRKRKKLINTIGMKYINDRRNDKNKLFCYVLRKIPMK
jgi:NAD-dependent dihydropyrimidine dehydrogenase PreA subunit